VKITPSAQIVVRNDGGAREPVRYLESRAQFRWPDILIEKRQARIEKHFHSELIQAFQDPRMTATQVLELAKLSVLAGASVFRFTGLLASLLIASLPFFRQIMAVGDHGEAVLPVLLGLTVGALFIDQLVHYRTEHLIRHMGASLLAICYLGIGAAVVLSIRIRFGLPAFVLFLAAVKSCDIGAYFVGSLIGRHKLIPWLSPGKTVEGLIGGMAVAAACTVGLSRGLAALFGEAGQGGMSLWAAAMFGATLGLAGQAADLCESALKRAAGLKDSGTVLPAFGGVLDVVDSPLLAAPVAYVLLAAGG